METLHKHILRDGAQTFAELIKKKLRKYGKDERCKFMLVFMQSQ